MKQINIPQKLSESISSYGDDSRWLERLPDIVRHLADQWMLTLEEPFGAEASCSWVAPCARKDGSMAVLKVGWPSMEAEDEAEGLRFWNGDPTAFLLDADSTHNAMLLERCEPGTILRTLPETEQDEIIAGLIRRLWRSPSSDFTFRPLSKMVHYWMDEAKERAEQWTEPTLVQEGLDVYQSLLDSTTDHVLLATDLHAGNVLRAEREPWLVIDPKPFVGDPAYDATQHLCNCWERLKAKPLETTQRFAHLLDIDAKRVQHWLFARAATLEWGDPNETLPLARKLAP